MKEDQEVNTNKEMGNAATSMQRSTSFLVMSLNGERIPLLVGFSAFSAWVNLLVGFEGFLRDSVVYGGGVVHDPLFIVTFLLSGILLITKALRKLRVRKKIGSNPLLCLSKNVIFCGVLGAISGIAGVILSSIAVTYGPFVNTGAIIIGIVAALFIVRYTIAWGFLITSFDLREMMTVLCSALCLQWLPFIIAMFFGPIGKVILAGCLPLLSLWGLKGHSDVLFEERAHRNRSLAAEVEGTRYVVGRMAAALFCFAFVVQFVWTCNVVMTSEPLHEDLFWLVYLCVFVACALIMTIIVYLMNWWSSYRMELFYRAAFAVGVVGSAALPLAYNHLFFSYAVIYVAYALITATMWLLVWSVVFMRHIAPGRVVGPVFGLQYVALPCGFGAAKLMQQVAAHLTESDLLPYVGFAAITLLVVAFVFILPERTLLLLSPRLLRLSHESLDERCKEIALTSGLTERETEIFTLLARGRDVAYIEKELFISRNTVNTHRKNLYRKLGIHTQQELLSLIEESLD